MHSFPFGIVVGWQLLGSQIPSFNKLLVNPSGIWAHSQARVQSGHPKFQVNKREVHPFLVEETEAGGD